ncbi:molybdopterin synthase sulfur carrier subunit-like protein [Dinothrombium tinctorium]|uniref:Molybdopterin synthase sulfur carrier subunit-like protein n=1 Tax=Dinothrombium tinctorium TaxID=1965070 RepID=A0A443R2U9_9ACAR|nr:molybdopterin synthase sulfur carrier subunit-like protein [Dinothrombium tinctorium]
MGSDVQIKLLLFAAAKERANGECERWLRLASKWRNDHELRDYICTQSLPALNEMKSTLALAINEEYCVNCDSIELKNGDTVALIPPITGG